MACQIQCRHVKVDSFTNSKTELTICGDAPHGDGNDRGVVDEDTQRVRRDANPQPIGNAVWCARFDRSVASPWCDHGIYPAVTRLHLDLTVAAHENGDVRGRSRIEITAADKKTVSRAARLGEEHEIRGQ